jgi:hypothetical protein
MKTLMGPGMGLSLCIGTGLGIGLFGRPGWGVASSWRSYHNRICPYCGKVRTLSKLHCRLSRARNQT